MRIGVLSSHPIQYQAPWFRELAKNSDLDVYFAHRQTAHGQAEAGYGVEFEWDVDLLTGYRSEFLRNIAQRPGVHAFVGCNTPEIQDVIARKRFDAFIVCGWRLLSYWQAVRACHRNKVPVFVRGDSQLESPRSQIKRIAKALAYPVMLKQFDGFLCVGQRNTAYLRHYRVPDHRLFHAPHFVDSEFFATRSAMTSDERFALRASFGAQPHDKVVMFAGRFVPSKRVEDIVDALAFASAQASTLRLWLVGAGALESSLRSRCEVRKVAVDFLGFRNQTELPKLYAAADMLVLASNAAETWGLVVNEAMACGLPAIVSDAVGCGPDLIVPGATGETYPLGDSSALGAAVLRVLRYSGSPSSRDALSRVSQQYSCEKAVEGTLNALHEVRAHIELSAKIGHSFKA